MCCILCFTANACIDAQGDLSKYAMSHVLAVPKPCTMAFQCGMYCSEEWPSQGDTLEPYPERDRAMYVQTPTEQCPRCMNIWPTNSVTWVDVPTGYQLILTYQTGEQPSSAAVTLFVPDSIWDGLQDEEQVLLKIAAKIPTNERHIIEDIAGKEVNWTQAEEVFRVLKKPTTMGHLSNDTWEAITHDSVSKGLLQCPIKIRNDARRMREGIWGLNRSEVDKYFPHYLERLGWLTGRGNPT